MNRIQYFLFMSVVMFCGFLQAQIDPGQYYGILSFVQQNFEDRPNLPDRIYRLPDVAPETFVFSNNLAYVLTKGSSQTWSQYKMVSMAEDLNLPIGEYQVVVNGFRVTVQIEAKKTTLLPLSQVLIETSMPGTKGIRIVSEELTGLKGPEATSEQSIVYPSIIASGNQKFEIVVRFVAGAETQGENYVHIDLDQNSGVQKLDLRDHTTRFTALQSGAILPDWRNLASSYYEINNGFSQAQKVPYSGRSLYYISHDNKLVSIDIGSTVTLPRSRRSRNCYEFYLNSTSLSQCLTTSTAQLYLGRVEVTTGQGGTFRIFSKRQDGSLERVLNEDLYGNQGLPVAPGPYLISVYEKNGDWLIEELVQTIEVEPGQTARVTSPMISKITLEPVWSQFPLDPAFRLFMPGPGYFVGGPRDNTPYVGWLMSVIDESNILVATLSGLQATQLKPGKYTLWVSGSQLPLAVDGTSNIRLPIGRIGIAKNQDTTPKSVFFVSQILSSGEIKPLFNSPQGIPFGYYIYAVPGSYEVTICPFGIEQACQKIPYVNSLEFEP